MKTLIANFTALLLIIGNEILVSDTLSTEHSAMVDQVSVLIVTLFNVVVSGIRYYKKLTEEKK